MERCASNARIWCRHGAELPWASRAIAFALARPCAATEAPLVKTSRCAARSFDRPRLREGLWTTARGRVTA